MIVRVEFEEWAPFPRERVFLFFANPENLPRIMPPDSDTQIDRLSLIAPDGSSGAGAGFGSQALAGVGSEILTSFRLLPPFPFRTPWIARITEFEWNQHFADVQEKGPFKRWHHRHEFVSETRDGVAGTTVRDRIEYSVGWGVPGVVAEKVFVSRHLRNTFARRQKALPGLLSEF